MRRSFLLLVFGVQTAFAAGQIDPFGELHRVDLLPKLRPGIECRMFSSYDRTGGNNDGFSGTYSKLRVENGGSVLAEMTGPGCIRRIWFTHSEHHSDGLLGLKREHIRIYLDGESEPALDIPLEELFSGNHPAFPAPLVGEALGGFTCYVPIPYRNGCKVVVEGTSVRFYHITYTSQSDAGGVESFALPLSQNRQRDLDRAVALWKDPGKLSHPPPDEAESERQSIELARGESTTWRVKGPGRIRAVLLHGSATNRVSAGTARLRIAFDGAEGAAVDLPLAYFFGQAFRPQPFQSLIFGNAKPDGAWYNVLPMPFRRGATFTLEAGERPVQCSLEAVVDRATEVAADDGYLHAVYREELPTQTGRSYRFLDLDSASGHYVGTYQVTEGVGGHSDLPFWLEGDETFQVDGTLMIHGTGSEDYFNCGWYAVPGRLNNPGARPLHGYPVFHIGEPVTRAASYRWHLADPVPFAHNIGVDIEHGGENDFNAHYRSVAFYYGGTP